MVQGFLEMFFWHGVIYMAIGVGYFINLVILIGAVGLLIEEWNRDTYRKSHIIGAVASFLFFPIPFAVMLFLFLLAFMDHIGWYPKCLE